jgi:hypothetical protein
MMTESELLVFATQIPSEQMQQVEALKTKLKHPIDPAFDTTARPLP